MLTARRVKGIVVRFSPLGLLVAGLLVLVIASCSSPSRPARRAETDLDPGWPRGNNSFHQASYRRLHVKIPEVPDAEVVEMDNLCEACHPVHSKMHANNVHQAQGCETCHGRASTHLESRGKEPNTILSFRSPDTGSNAGKLLSPAERSEICLQCHADCEPGQTTSGPQVSNWRTSAHGHKGVAYTVMHTDGSGWDYIHVPGGGSRTPACWRPGPPCMTVIGK